MTSTVRAMVRGGWLRLAVAGVVMVIVTMTATAAAVVAPAPAAAPQASRPGPGSPSPRSPFPGFVLEEGRYTTIEARDPGAKGTEAVKLNDRGQVVGEYSQDTPIVNDSANPRDYLWDRGRVTNIEIPGADPVRTEPVGVNNRGQVVGPYLDRDGVLLGFLWERGGSPPSTSPAPPRPHPPPSTTVARSWARTRMRRERCMALCCAGAASSASTRPTRGGPGPPGHQQPRPDRGLHARRPGHSGRRARVPAGQGARGPFTPISFPGAPRTIATGINDQGQIVGFYENPNATPSRQSTGGQPRPGMGPALTTR